MIPYLNTIPQTPETRWFMNKRSLFLTVPEARKSKIEANLVSGERPLSGSYMAVFLL